MFKVITPATTANIGPGFDILGLSLNLFNTFTVEKSETFQLYGFDEKYTNENNLVLQSYIALFNQLNLKPIPIKITIDCQIPTSRGLGSSSSCIVAGIIIANHILNNPLSSKELCTLATKLEGHPDNVVPCLLGGLCSSKLTDKELFISHYEISKKLKLVCLIPNFEVETKVARSVVPLTIDKTDTINNMSNLLLLLEGLKSNNELFIHEGIVDALHVPYRKKLIHDYDKVESILIKCGCAGFTISGSGPTCLALFTKDYSLETIKKELLGLRNDWQAIPLSVNHHGTRVED